MKRSTHQISEALIPESRLLFKDEQLNESGAPIASEQPETTHLSPSEAKRFIEKAFKDFGEKVAELERPDNGHSETFRQMVARIKAELAEEYEAWTALLNAAELDDSASLGKEQATALHEFRLKLEKELEPK